MIDLESIIEQARNREKTQAVAIGREPILSDLFPDSVEVADRYERRIGRVRADESRIMQLAERARQEEAIELRRTEKDEAGVKGYWQEFMDAVARGSASIGSAFKQAQARISSAEPAPGSWCLPWTPEQKAAKEARADEYREQAELYWRVASHPELAARDDTLVLHAINLIGETLPYITATTLAYTVGGPLGGFAVGALVEGNAAYRTALDNGVPEEQARQIGWAVGVISGAIESVGGKATEEILERIVRKKVQNKILQGGAVFGIGTLVESLEEGTQEITAIGGESVYRDVDWKERLTRILGAMEGGAFLGGTARGANIAAKRLARSTRRTQSLEDSITTEIAEKTGLPADTARIVARDAMNDHFEPQAREIGTGQVKKGEGYTPKVQPRPVKTEGRTDVAGLTDEQLAQEGQTADEATQTAPKEEIVDSGAAETASEVTGKQPWEMTASSYVPSVTGAKGSSLPLPPIQGAPSDSKAHRALAVGWAAVSARYPRLARLVKAIQLVSGDGSWNADSGTLSIPIGPLNTPGVAANVMVHELTHAAQNRKTVKAVRSDKSSPTELPAYARGKAFGQAVGRAAEEHRQATSKAVNRGDPVPREVLQEYAGEPWADAALAKAAEGKQPWEMTRDQLQEALDRDDTVTAMEIARKAKKDDLQKALGLGGTHTKKAILDRLAEQLPLMTKTGRRNQAHRDWIGERTPWLREMRKHLEYAENAFARGQISETSTAWETGEGTPLKEAIPALEKELTDGVIERGVPRHVLEEYKGEPWADAALAKAAKRGVEGGVEKKAAETASGVVPDWQKRPAVFPSTHTSGGKRVTQSAVNWRKITPSHIPNRLRDIYRAWDKLKQQVTGFVSWDNVAKETGLSVEDIASELKALDTEHPGKYVGRTVNRTNDGTYFKFKTRPPLAPVREITEGEAIQRAKAEAAKRGVEGGVEKKAPEGRSEAKLPPDAEMPGQAGERGSQGRTQPMGGGLSWFTPIVEGMRKSKEIRPEIELEQSVERSKRAGKYAGLVEWLRGKGASAEEALQRAKGAFYGPLTDYQRYEPIDQYLPDGAREAAFEDIATTEQLRPYDRANVADAFTKLLDGYVLAPWEAEALMQWRPELRPIVEPRTAKSSLWTQAMGLWRAGLLTGLKTSGLNMLSNLCHAMSEVAKDLPAVGADRFQSIFTGQRTMAFTAKGTIGGVKEGFVRGWNYMKTGVDERDVGLKYDLRKINPGKGKIARGLHAYEEFVFHLMGAEDQPFYYGAYARSLYSQAIAAGKNAGHRGAGLQTFVDDLVADPTDDMVGIAMTDAETAVFMNHTKLGDIGAFIQSQGGEVIIPFARTLSAIAMQIVNYTPVGLAKTAFEQVYHGNYDQRAVSMAFGRSSIGTGAIALGAAMVSAGILSLEYPETERERNQWQAEGRKPFSVKIGGKWRSVYVLGPIGNVLVIGGYFKRGMNETGSPTEAMSQALSGGAKSWMEETFLRGMNQFLEAIEDPERSWTTFWSSLAGSLVPTIIADIARATDTTERMAYGPVKRITSRIPWARKTLEPRLDMFGQDVPRYGGNPLEVMIDPTRPVKIRHDVVVDELRRLWNKGIKVTPTTLGNREGYAILSDHENTVLWRKAGELTYEALLRMMGSQWYSRVSDDRKGQEIERAVREAKAWARAAMAVSRLEAGDTIEELKEAGLITQTVEQLLGAAKAQNRKVAE